MKKAIWSICLLAPLVAFAGDPGTALKADSIKAEPYADAKTSGTLNKGDAVDIIAKKGAWLQIKSKNSSGWVRLLSVKRGSASGGGNNLGGVLDVANGRTGTGKVVSTTGIRGLSAEDLKSAKFNEDETKKMESYSTSAADAQQFAGAVGLQKSSLAYLKGAK